MCEIKWSDRERNRKAFVERSNFVKFKHALTWSVLMGLFFYGSLLIGFMLGYGVNFSFLFAWLCLAIFFIRLFMVSGPRTVNLNKDELMWGFDFGFQNAHSINIDKLDCYYMEFDKEKNLGYVKIFKNNRFYIFSIDSFDIYKRVKQKLNSSGIRHENVKARLLWDYPL